MSKLIYYTSHTYKNENYVELEPEFFLNTRKHHKKQINYKLTNDDSCEEKIFTPTTKSIKFILNKKNSSGSNSNNKNNIGKAFKPNINSSTNIASNIQLHFNDNSEKKENEKHFKKINPKFKSLDISNIVNEFKENNNNLNNLNKEDFINKKNNDNSNFENKKEIKDDYYYNILNRENSYYSLSEISSLDLNKTLSENNNNNSIED